MTIQEVESTGPSMKLESGAATHERELHRWMMMETKAHQVELPNSRYRSLPSCGGSAFGEAFTEWRDG